MNSNEKIEKLYKGFCLRKIGESNNSEIYSIYDPN